MAGTNPGTANLVSWWKLDEESGIRKDSHGSNNLADKNTVLFAVGKQENAALFASATFEHLDIPDNTSLSQTGNFSIGLWIRMGSKSANMAFMAKFALTGDQRSYRVRYNNGTDRFEFTVSDDGTAAGETNVTASSLGSPSNGTWYFIVCEHNATANTISIQVNNGVEDSTAHSTNVDDSTAEFILGGQGTGDTQNFTGREDEAFLFSSNLTADNRTFLYNAGVGVTYTNLTGYQPGALFSDAISGTPWYGLYRSIDSKSIVDAPLVHELTVKQIVNQKFVVPTTGVAEYKVRIKDHTGALAAEFSSDAWIGLNFNHNESDTSFCRFEILASDDRAKLFVPENVDYQLEIWRRNIVLGLDWYIEWEGFVRTTNDVLYINNFRTVVIYSVGYMNLITRAYVMYDSGTDFTSKSGVGETLMKEFVNENMGIVALQANGRYEDNVVPNFRIEADLARGGSYSGSRAHKGVFQSCVAIAIVSELSFDVVRVGDELLFEFRVYDGQRGLDRTIDNGVNDVAIFSVEMGNMSLVTLSQNRSNEKTIMYALGPGREAARQIDVVESNDQFDSPWNRIEQTVNASDQAISELESFATEKLKENEKLTSISFTALQQVNTYYGQHYWWGDKVSALFNGLQFDLRIIEVSISVSHRSRTGETIKFNFLDDKR